MLEAAEFVWVAYSLLKGDRHIIPEIIVVAAGGLLHLSPTSFERQAPINVTVLF